MKKKTPKEISLHNGSYFLSAEEAIEEIRNDWEDTLGTWEEIPWESYLKNRWEVIASFMDDETREEVNYELAPCTELEFLKRYLEIAPYDLVIG